MKKMLFVQSIKIFLVLCDIICLICVIIFCVRPKVADNNLTPYTIPSHPPTLGKIRFI